MDVNISIRMPVYLIEGTETERDQSLNDLKLELDRTLTRFEINCQGLGFGKQHGFRIEEVRKVV